jgi:hypothetical protein
MKKFISLLILCLVVNILNGQTMLIGTVANWSPATAKDTSFKSNLVFDGNYYVGLSIYCTACDSVYISFKEAPSNTAKLYRYAGFSINGTPYDSIFLNGTVGYNLKIDKTYFPNTSLDFNQIGNTKPTLFEAYRTKVKQN